MCTSQIGPDEQRDETDIVDFDSIYCDYFVVSSFGGSTQARRISVGLLGGSIRDQEPGNNTRPGLIRKAPS